MSLFSAVSYETNCRQPLKRGLAQPAKHKTLNLLFMKVSKENLQNPCAQRAGSLRRLLSPALLMLALLFTFTALNAQNNISVRGKITNENNQPVQRASVAVKGSSAGVTADDNGEFVINAPSDGTLVISAVNYATQEVRHQQQHRTGCKAQFTAENRNRSNCCRLWYAKKKRCNREPS